MSVGSAVLSPESHMTGCGGWQKYSIDVTSELCQTSRLYRFHNFNIQTGYPSKWQMDSFSHSLIERFDHLGVERCQNKLADTLYSPDTPSAILLANNCLLRLCSDWLALCEKTQPCHSFEMGAVKRRIRGANAGGSNKKCRIVQQKKRKEKPGSTFTVMQCDIIQQGATLSHHYAVHNKRCFSTVYLTFVMTKDKVVAAWWLFRVVKSCLSLL